MDPSRQNNAGPAAYNMLGFQPVPLRPPGGEGESPPFYGSPGAAGGAPPPTPAQLLSHLSPYPPSVTSSGVKAMPALPSVPLPPATSELPATKAAKGKKPRKRKSQPAPKTDATLSPPETPSSGGSTSAGGGTPAQNKEQQMKEFVARLLGHKNEGFTECEFAEKALMNLARKVFQTEGLQRKWAQVVQACEAQTDCVSVGRPKDGRMTVQKPGNGGTKKVFPQIILCQTFRWPNIVFHNDIKSTPGCQFPALIKPPEEAVPGVERINDTICINPYHYELTSECIARFNKAARAAQRAEKTSQKKERSKGSKKSTPPSLPPPPPSSGPSATPTAKDKKKKRAPKEPKVFDSKGVDYVKFWQDHSAPSQKKGFQKFSQAELLKEIKFLRIDAENGKIKTQDWDSKFIQGLKILDELDPILRGDYLRHIKPKIEEIKLKQEQKSEPREPKKEEEEEMTPLPLAAPPPIPSPSSGGPDLPSPQSGSAKEEESPTQEEELSQPASANGDGSMPMSTDDSTTIQDLLEDIRGSFERQFDDDFENLSSHVLGGHAGSAGVDPAASTNFNMDTSTFPGYPHQANSQAAATPNASTTSMVPEARAPFESPNPHHGMAPLTALGGIQSPPVVEMPCIVNSWSMPTTSGRAGVGETSASYLAGGSLGPDEYENLYRGGAPQPTPPTPQQQPQQPGNHLQLQPPPPHNHGQIHATPEHQHSNGMHHHNNLQINRQSQQQHHQHQQQMMYGNYYSHPQYSQSNNYGPTGGGGGGGSGYHHQPHHHHDPQHHPHTQQQQHHHHPPYQ